MIGFCFSITATLSGLYWYFDSAVINDTEYHYFAYGMRSRMDTPPTFSYVCNNAIFMAYNPEKHGSHNFQDKFRIKNLQV